MSVAAIIQARMGSTRLPGKVLADVAGDVLLAHVVARTRGTRLVDQTVVATTNAPGDDVIAALCDDRDWDCFRGSESDVLDRYYQAGLAYEADHIVRITADCPFVCPHEADRVIARHLDSRADYTHNITVWGSGMPLGTGTEIFTRSALARSWRDGHEAHHREHVDEYVGDHPELFAMERVDAPDHLRRPELRLTVDTPEDLLLVREVYGRLRRPGELIELADVIGLLDESPDLVDINRHVVQKKA
jgi:spore coat polysaccharide biosynthesis protein SpsF (cytidylyltransferase family)